MSPYPNITLAMPGRHGEQTTPKHGDFVVMVNDPIWPLEDHQFKHDDIFTCIEQKRNIQPNPAQFLMEDYLSIVQGDKPPAVPKPLTVTILGEWAQTMNDFTFLYAVQCLAVAEHRRYAQYESKFGGRFLPFRFAAGIAEGLWSAEAAIAVQKKGRPGVEWLEKDYGLPSLTKELMK